VTIALTAALVVFGSLAIEAAVSARHDRALRALGAVEPRGDVYRAMQLAYPAAFLALISEGVWRGAGFGPLAAAGAGVFLAAKALKYWAIASLGMRWTFRVLVPPGSPRTSRGPYRWIAHPNYIAVALELTGVALAMRARVSGPLAVALFSLLMLKRVRIEEKALAGQ
jgi:methyltransferase